MSDISIDNIQVLLVEPSQPQHKIIERYLHEIGVSSLDWVKTGAEAQQVLSENCPDLVISTMYLEDMTGSDLVIAMRNDESLHDLPFMLISSETSFRYLDPVRQAGVIAILPKPFEVSQLRQAFLSTLDYIDPGELETQAFSSEELEVLVVDDSLTARRHISRVLNNMGIENLTEASNGIEALQILSDKFFDLVVTDYNMPEMNGKELVEHIRNESSQASIPILMVSSENDQSRLAAVQQAGVSAICDKPFESDNVKALLENMLIQS